MQVAEMFYTLNFNGGINDIVVPEDRYVNGNCTSSGSPYSFYAYNHIYGSIAYPGTVLTTSSCARVALKTVGSIELNRGFHSQAGSVFNAIISRSYFCDNYTNERLASGSTVDFFDNSSNNWNTYNETGNIDPTESGESTEPSIFPNPAKTLVSVVSPDGMLIDYAQLLTLQGEVIETVNGNHQKQVELSLENIPSGLYVLRISSGGNSYTKRLEVIK